MKKFLNCLFAALFLIAPMTLKSDLEETVTQEISFTNTTHLGSNHSYRGVTYFADHLEIEDGSLWYIRPAERWITLDWIPGDLILLTQSSWWSKTNFGYYFSFYNVRTGQTVDVEAATGPALYSVYRRFIVSIDYYYGDASLMLDDGSIWHLSESDRNIWQRWSYGQTVILGSNGDTFGSWLYPNLLVNVTEFSTFVTSKCLNAD